MDEFKKQKRKKLIRNLIILAVVVVAVGGWIFANRDTEGTTEATLNTEPLQKRTIVNTISGSGTVEAQNSEEVTSTMAGSTIDAIYVSEGDYVIVGQKIASLDTSNLQDQRNSLNERITNLQQQKTDALAQNAQDQVDAAIAADNAFRARIEAEQAAAEAAAAQAKQRESAVSALQTQLVAAQSQLATDQATLQQMQEEYEKKTTPSEEDGKAEWNVTDEAAVNYYNSILQQRTIVASDQSQVQSLTQSIASVQSTSTSSTSITSSLPQTTTTTVASAEDIAKTYDDSIATLQEQVNSLNKQIANGTVTAKTAGTVTEVMATEGETYLGTGIVLIEGVESLQITAEVDEYDIPDVTVGMPVVIKTDATRSEELQGEVSYVALKATGSGGSSGTLSSLTSSLSSASSFSSLTGGSSGATFTVKITLNEPNDRLRIGMNAKVSIMTEQAEDVWSVPFEALHQEEDGSYYIEVLEDGATATFTKEDSETEETENEEESTEGPKTRKIPVTTGIEGTYYVEIRSGELVDGLQVVIPDSEGGNSMEEIMNLMGSGAGV